jgi:hypothetical protein
MRRSPNFPKEPFQSHKAEINQIPEEVKKNGRNPSGRKRDYYR